MRLYYLDNLRSILMVLGLVLHTCAAFSTQEFWLVTHHQTIPLADTLNQSIHVFRMPLFFMVSGFFAYMMMNKQSIAVFVKTKLLRIAIPFLSVFLLINLPQSFALDALNNHSDELRINSHSVTGHLWFLLNLLFYFLIYVLLHKAFRVFDFVAKRLDASHYTAAVVFVLPVLFTVLLALNKVGLPIYEKIPVLGSFYSLFSYFDYFLIGALLARLPHSALLAGFKSRSAIIYLLILACLAIALKASWLEMFISPSTALGTIVFAYLEHLFPILFCLLLWYFSYIFINKNNKWFVSLSKSSYSIYLFHHFIIIAAVVLLNYLFVTYDFSVNRFFAFFGVISITLFTTLVLHFLLINRIRLFSLLFNGKA